MKVLQGLAREHADFEKLIKRLEVGAAGDEAAARRDVRNALLILVSALDSHERVENVVFGNPSYASREDARRIVQQVEFQHRKIQELRLEFTEAITSSEALPIQRLRFLTGRMAESLRLHFKTEEECLWPHYVDYSRSLDASIRRRLEKSVKALEGDIAANSAAIAEYLETKK